MSIATLTSGRKWPFVLISLAVLMLGFAGSFYPHAPGHQHIHATENASSVAEHDHIQLSGDNELGVESLLHCGADILGDGRLKGIFQSNHRQAKFARHNRPLIAYYPIQDPPPPRYSS